MIKAREWPVKAMYMLIAAALAISLFITAAPAPKVSATTDDVTSAWERVSTPSTEDWVLAPESRIVDYAVGDDGAVAYAAVYTDYDMDGNGTAEGYCLLKSTDGAATWKDITKGVKKEIEKEGLGALANLVAVACDAAAPDFLAVALALNNTTVRVFISHDGGSIFQDIGAVAIPAQGVYAFAVSTAVGGVHNIAIGGTDSAHALIFRCQVTGDLGDWDDATTYKGWDNINDDINTNDLASKAVVDIKFIPGWSTAEKTILVATANTTAVYLQTGSWGTNPAWNKKSTALVGALLVTPASVTIPLSDLNGLTAGIAVPSDYASASSDTRVVWVNVNYIDTVPTPDVAVGAIFRVEDTSEAIAQQPGDKKSWLTNVSYWGTVAEGKAIAGVLGDGLGGDTTCCTGVDVYRTSNVKDMGICCPPGWKKACKPPTGIYAMAAFYVSADKAYAVALGPLDAAFDEGAWSVSFDDGDTWNQLSLIDTKIDYLSDVAVSPNCNKMMLVSVHKVTIDGDGEYCGCDSVWLKATTLAEAEEYNGQWLRTYCFQLKGDNSNDFDGLSERGLLRLAPEEMNGDTVYLVDRMTDTVYWSEMEGMACWKWGTATVDEIVDLAVSGNKTIYALAANGDVAMSDNFANTASWTEEPVESKVDNGWTIAVHGDDILVGGQDGQVSYSHDNGETFTKLEDIPTIDGLVTVAFDSYFDTNNTIYAATALAGNKNGIYRWVIGTSEDWKNLGAEKYDYTGLVLGFKDGNPKTSKDTGGVLYASYVGHTYGSNWSSSDDFFNCWKGNAKDWYTGVARTLTPAADISCEKCIEWDYLTVGLTDNEYFIAPPYALKICGCTDPTTNTKLFAIGTADNGYDMDKAKYGTVWTFEDCYAKKSVELTSTNNVTVPADCNCSNLPFTIKWDAVCDACYYDVQIALDNQFTDVVADTADYQEGGKDILGATGLSYVVPSILTCQVTYYWRVRAHEASTCQIIHSWWSGAQSFTVAPSAEQGAITLIAPVSGATDVPTKNVGFSWNVLASANKFDWKLSANADLSSPLESKTLTNTAYTYTGTLTHGTTYYWQVTAWKDSTKVSTSAVGTFTTGATGAFCCPVCGLCFETEQLLKDHTAAQHPAQPATPFWVWVVIAIGAVLVIVVIVLIFRTRRV